jgi:hypothetical protein
MNKVCGNFCVTKTRKSSPFHSLFLLITSLVATLLVSCVSLSLSLSLPTTLSLFTLLLFLGTLLHPPYQPIIYFFIPSLSQNKKPNFILFSIVSLHSFSSFSSECFFFKKKFKFLAHIVDLLLIFSSGSFLFFIIMNSTFCLISIIVHIFLFLINM